MLLGREAQEGGGQRGLWKQLRKDGCFILYIFLIYCFEGDDGSPVYTYVILLKNLLRSSLICQLHFNKAI